MMEFVMHVIHQMKNIFKLIGKKRKEEFENILKKYRSNGSNYDCIIPVSGGKDSCYQAISMRDNYNMNPLCVTHTPVI